MTGASILAPSLGTPALLLVSAGFSLLGLGAAGAVARTQRSPQPPGAETKNPLDTSTSAPEERAIIGGSAWEGLKAVFRSRYLSGIAGYVIIMSIMATLLYTRSLS